MSESRSLTVAERLSAIPAFAMSESELLATLGDSIYPGAKPVSIKMAVAYCKANALDPFQKPVHIVPMSVKKPGTDAYEWRDIVMPGVGLYRVQAARTGQYAGVDEGVFGPDTECTFKREDGHEVKLTVPEWCSVTVYRIVGGHRVAFSSGRVYWLETYATASRKTDVPNSMWFKRKRGQLEKCAEAMALRRAFPEIGSQPTVDELEGKSLDVDDLPPPLNPEATTERPRPQSKSEQAKANAVDIDPETGEITDITGTPPNAAAAAAQAGPQAHATNGNGEAKASPPASAGMLKLIRSKAAAKEISEADLCTRAGITTLDGITIAEGNALLKDL